MIIGIIGAMEQEITILRDTMIDVLITEKAGLTFYSGSLCEQPVVLVQSGICKVAAAIATTMLIEHFGPVCVINTGCAGGFQQSLEIGSLIISSEVRHHDVDVTAFDYEIDQVPKMPSAFHAHPTLIKAAQEAIAEMGMMQIVTGLICSGDSFMSNPVGIEKTRADFPQVLAVDMEGAAIAQTCYQLNTPFIVIRSLSDIAGKEAPESFETYVVKASDCSSKMIMALIGKFKSEPLE